MGRWRDVAAVGNVLDSDAVAASRASCLVAFHPMRRLALLALPLPSPPFLAHVAGSIGIDGLAVNSIGDPQPLPKRRTYRV
jgi:hypothetical protein